MKNEIGGYFELELPKSKGLIPHSDAYMVQSGEKALECILSNIQHINKVFLPYYTCTAVLRPLERLGIKYEFYHINRDLTIPNIGINDNEYIIVTNYFGIFDAYIMDLWKQYGLNLIIDNSQALFADYIIDSKTFYSPRKFVGTPDGGMFYSNQEVNLDAYENDYSFERCSHLLKRIDCAPETGYLDFKENNKILSGIPIRKMSRLTYRLLESIDFQEVYKQRKANFIFLHKYLCKTNVLRIPNLNTFNCPLVYPYMIDDEQLRDKLIKHRIFVAQYWPNVLTWCQEGDVEYDLAKNTLALPIDQRYDEEDMKRIVEVIKMIRFC